MSDRVAKNALYDGFAAVAKALGSGRRAEIVDVLAQGERSVEEIATEIGQSMANTSQHLRQLSQAGLLVSRRQGARVIYGVAGPGVVRLWTAIRDLAAEQVAEVERLATAYLGDRSDLSVITRDQLSRRLRAGDVVVVDVRPGVEFAAGHIPGAISAPLPDLARVAKRLPADREVVAYCRGPFCVYADEAVRRLRRRGLHAARLEDGFPEWQQAGLPVATEG